MLEIAMEIPDPVLGQALQIAGGDLERVRRWWSAPIADMGGITPEQLVASGPKRELLDHLESIESGYVDAPYARAWNVAGMVEAADRP